MPRQDVPYGGAICRLRERIAEIFDKLGEKLHTINGVPGDGDGNVKIVSGSSAVVINNDPTQNEIAVSLDTSQLPAASVSSVNGQTGAVALDAGDIPSDGNSDVQSDIDALQTMDGALQGNINAEALARQGADATLQTNINAVSASLPAAAAAAVAADPTVAQLVVDLGNKVDLSDVSTVETPDTIAKRNGSGRLVAADPASGATDKTLVTANWVSQTGNSAPNNLIHKTGNENKNGNMYFDGGLAANSWFSYKYSRNVANGGANKYLRKYTANKRNNQHHTTLLMLTSARSGDDAGRNAIVIITYSSYKIFLDWVYKGSGFNGTVIGTLDANDKYDVWISSTSNIDTYYASVINETQNNSVLNDFFPTNDATLYDKPIAADYVQYTELNP